MTVTIGTQLLRLDPYRDSRSGPPPVYVVVGETRQSWLVEREPASGGFVTMVDKATMLERGKGERRARYMTVPEYEHGKRRADMQAKVRSATSSYTWLEALTDEKLDQLAALLDVKGYEPLVKPVAPVASAPPREITELGTRVRIEWTLAPGTFCDEDGVPMYNAPAQVDVGRQGTVVNYELDDEEPYLCWEVRLDATERFEETFVWCSVDMLRVLD